MDIVIDKMTLEDLEKIDLKNFDDFWTYNILKEELVSPTSHYIIAKSNEDIIGFAGVKFLLDEAHIINIVTRLDKRNNRYWFKTSRFFNKYDKGNL